MNVSENEILIKQAELELAAMEDKSGKEYMLLAEKVKKLKIQTYINLTPWDKVCLARNPKRAKATDYIKQLFSCFYEMHGDRNFADDSAIVGGIAEYKGIPVTVIAQSKGENLQENIKKNFGMASPEGYRKVLRLAKQAEKFSRPIITIVDTPGAYPGKDAEERGQAQAIAECLYTFSNLKVPVISIVISEGGSGGALALTVADKIYMLENAVYSILSPEGFASILYKDEKLAKEAAFKMKLTAQDLYEKKIADEVIKEPLGGVNEDVTGVCLAIEKLLDKDLKNLMSKKTEVLLKDRYIKFRSIGVN